MTEPAENPRTVDLSHVIEDGLITYQGLPAPVICDFLTREASRAIYADGTEFQIGKIELISNTGTYLDTPFHRFADGVDLSELSLNVSANLPGVLVDATGRDGRSIDVDAFSGVEVAGRAVLVRTGWDAHWRTDAYFEGHPFLTERAAVDLVAQGAVLVGIDSYNIDDTGDMRRPVHTTLLGAGIPIVEHMTGLARLPASGFRFTATPPKIKGMGTFPVRAFAILD
jgi:kynurenine formamidase